MVTKQTIIHNSVHDANLRLAYQVLQAKLADLLHRLSTEVDSLASVFLF